MPTIGKFVIGNVGTLQSASNIYIDPVVENFTYIQATSSNVAMALKDLDERFESIGTPPSLSDSNTWTGTNDFENGLTISGGSISLGKARLSEDSNAGNTVDSLMIFDASDGDAAKTITISEIKSLMGVINLSDTNVFTGHITASNGLRVEDTTRLYNTNLNPTIDGLGDTSEYHLHIEGDASTNSSMGIAFGSSNKVGAAILHVDTGGYSQGDLAFYTKEGAGGSDLPIERLRIKYDGNIGIGTDTPQAPLDIYEMGGLILGYTRLNNGGAAGNVSYIMTTSLTVPNSNWYTTFKAPASGKVEIQFSGFVASAASSATKVYLGLSTSSSWSSLGNKYIREVWETDDGDNVTVEHSWVLTGLTPGTTYTYYIGTKASAGSVQYWRYGGSNANLYKDLTIKAMALPNTIVTD